MRLFTFIPILFLSVYLLGQKNCIVGEYRNYSGGRISLRSDSTFYYKSLFSTLGTYASGTWSVLNDTIFLKPILKDKRIKSIDGGKYITLSVSSDKRSIVTFEEFVTFPFETSIGIPLKLYLKKNKLYEINEKGKIIKGNRKYPQPYEAEK